MPGLDPAAHGRNDSRSSRDPRVLSDLETIEPREKQPAGSPPIRGPQNSSPRLFSQLEALSLRNQTLMTFFAHCRWRCL